MFKKIKLTASADKNIRVVQKQENQNSLSAIKSSDDKFVLVESQIGIGTMYALQSIFNGINNTFLNYNIGSPLNIPDDAPKDLIVIDANCVVDDIDIEDIYSKLEEQGFKKIIIVTMLITKEPEDRLSGIMVD